MRKRNFRALINCKDRFLCSMPKYFSEGIPNQQSLNRWMRVVYNLISGTDKTGSPEIRDVETVRKAISYLDTIDSHNAISVWHS